MTDLAARPRTTPLMGFFGFPRFAWGVSLVAWASLVGCGRPSDVRSPDEVRVTEAATRTEPESAADRAILAKVGELAPGKTTHVAGWFVTVGRPYKAASGAECRPFAMTKDETSQGGNERTRLACKDANGWFFAPEVIAGEAP